MSLKHYRLDRLAKRACINTTTFYHDCGHVGNHIHHVPSCDQDVGRKARALYEREREDRYKYDKVLERKRKQATSRLQKQLLIDVKRPQIKIPEGKKPCWRIENYIRINKRSKKKSDKTFGAGLCALCRWRIYHHPLRHALKEGAEAEILGKEEINKRRDVWKKRFEKHYNERTRRREVENKEMEKILEIEDKADAESGERVSRKKPKPESEPKLHYQPTLSRSPSPSLRYPAPLHVPRYLQTISRRVTLRRSPELK